MKADIDRLMAERGLDALVVVIGDAYSPQLDYLVGRIHVSGGLAFKDWEREPVLVVNAMEIEEAAATGYTAYTYDDLGYLDLLNAHQGDALQAQVALWGKCLEKLGTPNGRIGVYGVADLEQFIPLLQALNVAYPQFEFVGEYGAYGTTLFDVASMTKDAQEIARIRAVGERTSAVVRATWDFIAAHRADENECVIKADDSPLTIGDVKRFVRRTLLDYDLEDTGMIFAQGRDAAIPHNHGQDAQPLKLGEAIVFDLFPRELGGGYHHDMTRTWCIGYAPDEVRNAYHQVMEAFDVAWEMTVVGRPVGEIQHAVQDYFEGHHHPTSRSHPGTTDGYVHGLGHGVGLKIHEGYNMSHRNTADVVQVGNVITIEPGLYYPEQGYGVRVEDTVYVDVSGALVSLTDVPKDLVLPLRG